MWFNLQFHLQVWFPRAWILQRKTNLLLTLVKILQIQQADENENHPAVAAILTAIKKDGNLCEYIYYLLYCVALLCIPH